MEKKSSTNYFSQVHKIYLTLCSLDYYPLKKLALFSVIALLLFSLVLTTFMNTAMAFHVGFDAAVKHEALCE
jgi:hypothetical protein